MHAGAALDGWRRQPTWNPLVLLIDLARQRVRWPAAGTPVLVATIAVLATSLALIAVWLWRGRTPPQRIADRAARLLARGRELHPVSEQGVRKIAERFGVKQPGLPVGYAVAGGKLVYASWEDVQTDIAGPRRRKTLGAGDPDDPVGAGRGVRDQQQARPVRRHPRCCASATGRCGRLDPEQLVGEPASWWWNPLSYVTSDRKAAELTGAFVDAYRHPDAKPDPFFDPKGEKLVEAFMRAAALDHRPLTDCYLWSTKPHDETPARILEAHGLRLMAASVMGEIDAPVEQRGGVYGTAERILAFLRDPDIARLVLPDRPGGPAAAARPRPRSCARAPTPCTCSPRRAGARRPDWSPRWRWRCATPPRPTPAPAPKAGCPSRWSACSTRRRTSAAGRSSPASTPTTGRGGSRC